MSFLKNFAVYLSYLLILVYFLSLNISCTEKIAGSEVTNEDAVCLVGKVLDQRGQGVSNIIARLDKIQLADTTDNNGNYSLKLSKQEISNLKINLDTLSDTVKIISSGNVASSINITKWIDTLPSVYLIQRNIYGQLNTEDTDFKRIEAVISILDEENHIISNFTKELWFNNGTKGYSGFSYFPKNSRNQKYSVYVKVFNRDSIYTGKSEMVYFNDIAGDIEIPSFSPDFNPELQITVGKDTTLTINDTLQLSAHIRGNSSFPIKKWEWNINRSGFKQTATGDTTIVLSTIPSNYLCVSKAIDTFGNIAIDTILVHCVQDTPTIAFQFSGPYYLNKKATIKGNSNDFGKIKNWEWSIDGINYEQIDSNHVSYITFITPATFKNLKCKLKVTDDDGNVKNDSCVFTFGLWQNDYDPFNRISDYQIVSPITFHTDNIYRASAIPIDNKIEISLKIYNGATWDDLSKLDIIASSQNATQLDCKASRIGELYSVVSIKDSLFVYKYFKNSSTKAGQFSHGSDLFCTSISQDGTFFIATTEGNPDEKHILLYQYKNGIWTLIPSDGLEKGTINSLSLETINNDIYLSCSTLDYKFFLYRFDGNSIAPFNMENTQAFRQFSMCTYNNELYIFGSYLASADLIVYFIKKFNNSNFQDLIPEFSFRYPIEAFTLYKGEILLAYRVSGTGGSHYQTATYKTNSFVEFGGSISRNQDSELEFFNRSENYLYTFYVSGGNSYYFKLQ